MHATGKKCQKGQKRALPGGGGPLDPKKGKKGLFFGDFGGGPEFAAKMAMPDCKSQNPFLLPTATR